MRGLLSTRDIRTANTPLGLLGIAPPVNRSAMAAPAPAPSAPPRRERVSGWRLLDRVLGGQTITEGLDAERERLEAEARRPQQEAEMARLRALAAQQGGPLAELALAFNPEEAGKAFASNLEGYTLGAGGMRGGIGGVVASAPTFTTVNDTVFRNDPAAGSSTPTATAAPAYSDITGRINAENPVLAPGAVWVGPDGQPRAQGAPRLQALSDGAELFDEQGRPIAQNVRDAPPVDPEDARRNADRANAALERIRNTRAAVEQAKEQAGGWTAGAGAVLAAIPGTPAANLAATIDTIQANLSFTELQKMRESSPTGGALGGIAVRELDLLGATVASLSQRQSPEQLQESLKTIEESLTRWENAVRQAQQQGQQGQSARPRARNPQTGEVIEWNGSAWVPAR